MMVRTPLLSRVVTQFISIPQCNGINVNGFAGKSADTFGKENSLTYHLIQFFSDIILNI